MEKYIFKNLEIVQLDDLIDETEVTGTLLKAYARIAAIVGDGNPAGDAHASSSGGGCDGGTAPSVCP